MPPIHRLHRLLAKGDATPPMALLLLLLVTSAATQYQYVYPMVQHPVQNVQMQQAHPRLVYYPVRTNCQTRCVPQTRYRWTYRPLVPMVQRPIVPINPPPSVFPLPAPPVVTPARPCPSPCVPVTVPFTIVPSTTPSTVTAPPAPLPPITTPPTPAPLITTITPETTAAPLETQPPPTTTSEPTSLPTPGPESTTTSTLPTPPPESTTAATETTSSETPPAPSTPKQARPAKKPGVVTPDEKEAHAKQSACVNGRPLVNDFGAPITCNVLVEPNGACPESHFCHAGVSFSTTVCCPRAAERVPRCEQPREVGTGRETAARWHYDTMAKECRRFLYKGLRGNENNFITKTQCMDACDVHETKGTQEVLKNPCRFGEFARNGAGRKIECSAESGNDACPAGFFCHVGDSAETTACCEGSGLSDPCLLSLNMGVGSGQLRRFYYNTLTKRCGEFVYKGAKGNENNFRSLPDCEAACKKWSDPCPISIGRIALRTSCSLDGGECAASEWCHVGHSALTTVCCPGAADPCELPLSPGEGGHNLTRWYADPSDRSCSRKCKPFQYGGTKGNQNNFVTRQMCEEKCKRNCRSPCGTGEMLLSSNDEPRQCSPLSPCPGTHWCHVGVTAASTVCCSAVSNTCELSLEVGFGSSHLTRWRFDGTRRKCVSFIYSGEGGNQNMFLTAEDCAQVCATFTNPCGVGKPVMLGSEPKVCVSNERCPSTHFCHFGAEDDASYCCPKNGDPCSMDLSSGSGDSSLPRFYFDRSSRRCRPFNYNGAKGNANNFRSLEECQTVCPVVSSVCREGDALVDGSGEAVVCGGEMGCPAGYFCHVGAAPETTNCCPGSVRRACDQPMEQGEGDARLERFYFDGTSQMCRTFFYRGLKGNANNFLSKAACRESCKEMNPCGGGGEPFADGAGERMLCTGGQRHDSCPTGFFCHVGAAALTTICCPKTNDDPCDAPLSEGAGRESLPRFFYDRRAGRCGPFSYGGVGGNENNFISLATCQRVCPAFRSYCPHGMPLTESSSGELATCGVDHACPAGFICHLNGEFDVSVCCQDPADFCRAPRESGPCSSMEKRYGYDADSDTCVEYEYGGCEGTLNNFRSLRRCTEICCKSYRLRRWRV